MADPMSDPARPLHALNLQALADWIEVAKLVPPISEMRSDQLHAACLAGVVAVEENAALLAHRAQLRDVLTDVRAAINPSDRDGISLHEWNTRLKVATAQIDAVLASGEGTDRP